MRDLRLIVGVSGVMAAFAIGASGCGKAIAQSEGKQEDRDIELTIYKDNFAMVSERRPISVNSGNTTVTIDDVSKLLDPKSILFDWPESRSHPGVVATTYRVGAESGTSMIGRLNGQNVQLMLPTSDGKQGDLISGKLESTQDGNGFSLRTPERLYVAPVGTIVASPNTASALPQLSVEVNSSAPAKTALGMSYLTGGMSWSADYVAKLNSNANTAELDCWATITNGTGIPFPAAKLTLMAGALNHSIQTISLNPSSVIGGTPATVPATVTGGVSVNLSSSGNTYGIASNVPRQAVGELYAYDIPARATIGVDQMNRVSVLGTRTVPVNRNYSIHIPTLSAWGYWSGSNETGSKPHVGATFSLSFANNSVSNLGVPLPSGEVRVYEKDNKGHERYTGSDVIPDTPKGDHITLALSNAFDVYADYKVLKSDRVAKHKLRKTVEVTVYNEKKTDVKVKLIEDFGGAWLPLSESEKSEKLDSQSVQWRLPVKAGSEKTLAFTVDLKE